MIHFNNNPDVETLEQSAQRICREIVELWPYVEKHEEMSEALSLAASMDASSRSYTYIDVEVGIKNMSINSMILGSKIDFEALRAERISLLCLRALQRLIVALPCNVSWGCCNASWRSSADAQVKVADKLLQAARFEQQTDYANMSIADVYARLC